VSITPTGIASAEAFGTAIVSAALITPTGIVSVEAFGIPILDVPAGLAISDTADAVSIDTSVTAVLSVGNAAAQALSGSDRAVAGLAISDAVAGVIVAGDAER
jgi:hypothetical protein